VANQIKSDGRTLFLLDKAKKEEGDRASETTTSRSESESAEGHVISVWAFQPKKSVRFVEHHGSIPMCGVLFRPKRKRGGLMTVFFCCGSLLHARAQNLVMSGLGRRTCRGGGTARHDIERERGSSRGAEHQCV
jgi:hypothetical protein